MSSKPIRQVTPPSWRIWVLGAIASTVAAAANAGWLYVTTNVFKVALLVPRATDQTVLVQATQLRVIVATVIGGLAGTAAAWLVGKSVIAPRIWVRIFGFAIGLGSMYSAVTLPIGVTTSPVVGLSVNPTLIHVNLAIMHVIATFIVVPALVRAVTIHDGDLEAADRRYHAHIDAQRSAQTPIDDSTITSPVVIPLAMPGDTIAVDLGANYTQMLFDPNALVGLTEGEAVASITNANYILRVIERDGQLLPALQDERADRVNLSIANGRVTHAVIG